MRCSGERYPTAMGVFTQKQTVIMACPLRRLGVIGTLVYVQKFCCRSLLLFKIEIAYRAMAGAFPYAVKGSRTRANRSRQSQWFECPASFQLFFKLQDYGIRAST